MLVDLKLQKVPNYFITAKKHRIVYITLMRRFIDKTISN